MDSHIRRIPIREIAPALDLVWRVFSEFEAPEYCAEGIEEFQKFIGEENIAEKMEHDGMILWGWYEGDTIAGMVAVTETGHINLLFVDAAYHRRGIAKALNLNAEQFFRERGVATVTVNSSPYAVEVYRRFGFTPTSAEQTVSGIRFTPMILRLREIPSD